MSTTVPDVDDSAHPGFRSVQSATGLDRRGRNRRDHSALGRASGESRSGLGSGGGIASARARLRRSVVGFRQGSAVTSESRMFRGLMVPGTRKVSYAIVDPHVARQMFIEDGLVRKGFQRTFRSSITIGIFRTRSRRIGLSTSSTGSACERARTIAAFYESTIPSTVVDLDSFTVWFVPLESTRSRR